MRQKIQIMLKEYIADVEDVCNILINGINCTEKVSLKNKYDFFKYRSYCKKMEFEVGGFSYRLHGKGCTACNGKKVIEWDFGYRSRWCGISPWKVSMTLKKNNSLYTEFYDETLIQTACEQFVKEGIMFKQQEQYYFELTEKETFKPKFPTEYDTLIIEYTNSRWLIPRSKSIERFIKKSTRVHNQINTDVDKYMLRFLLDGEEVCRIPYNDRSYPENAVKIMSDVIIKKISESQ